MSRTQTAWWIYLCQQGHPWLSRPCTLNFLSRTASCPKPQPGLVNWFNYGRPFAGVSSSPDTSLCAQTVVQAPQKHGSPSSPRMAHASQCPEEGYPPQAPPGHCWGTYKATKYLVQGLVGSLDLHGGLASRYTQLFESHCSSSFTSNSIFFFLAVQEILHLSALSAPRFYFPILFFPLVTHSSVFLLPFPCPRELRSLELTLISKVVVKPSAESRFFSQALNICQQTFWGSACCHNRLCGKTHPCLSSPHSLPQIW